MSNMFRNYDLDATSVPHFQSLIAGTLVLIALLGPLGMMAAKVAGY